MKPLFYDQIIVALGIAFVATATGTWAFRVFAIRRGIIANPNFRSLHQTPIPRGGGIVLSIVFILASIGLWLTKAFDENLTWALVWGGVTASTFGFIDDVKHIGPKTKFLIQGVLAAWVLYCFGGNPLVVIPIIPLAVSLTLSWVVLVWLMNLYNFMDGTDGMAASGAVFMCGALILLLHLNGDESHLKLILGLLAACCIGFLIFNWPNASIFMGDAGSLFLGFCFCSLIVHTVTTEKISVWTWLVLFGYFAGDTTTTTLVRIMLVQRWYGEHRSHAYQNLARLYGSHQRVLLLVWLYHIIWILPLAIWSTLYPSGSPLTAALALAPVVIWTLRYGPRLSST